MVRYAIKSNGFVDVFGESDIFDLNAYVAVIESKGYSKILRQNTGVKTILQTDREVRDDFADCSSGNTCGKYYDCIGQALDVFNSTLMDYGYHLNHDECMDWAGDEGRRQVTILDEFNETTGIAQFTYYKMPSGRWEIIGYIT